MKDRAARIFPLVAAIVFLALLLDWLRREPRAGLPVTVSAPPPLPVVTGATIRLAAAEILRAVADALSGPDAPVVLQARLENFFSQPRALPNESVLTFRDNAAYQAFLARAAAAGLEVAGRVDGLLSARVRFTTLDGLAGDLLANAGDYLNVAINTVVVPPTAPAPEDRAGGPQVPVGNNLLSELGITGDRSTWGQGGTRKSTNRAPPRSAAAFACLISASARRLPRVTGTPRRSPPSRRVRRRTPPGSRPGRTS